MHFGAIAPTGYSHWTWHSECLAADGILGDQGASYYCRGRDHGHEQHHEGYATELRGDIPTKCYQGVMSNHRRT